MKMPLEKTSIVVVKLSGGRGFEAAASTNKEKTMRETYTVIWNDGSVGDTSA
jgi:hypothetical protein